MSKTSGLSTRFLLIAGYGDSLIGFRGALISDLLDQDATVHVAVPQGEVNSSIRSVLGPAGVVIHEIPLVRSGTNPISDMRLFLKLFLLMRKIRPNKVLAYTVKAVIYGSLAAWLAKVPDRFALVTGLGYSFTGDRRGLVVWFVKWLYRFALGKVDKVFFQNPDDELLFRDQRILPARVQSLIVNGSGIDTTEFSVQQSPEGPTRFLMIARLIGDKGVREYVQAAEQVRESHQDVGFDLAGWVDVNPDAISKKDLERWVEDGHIRYLGYLDDVRPAIASSSVYVLPSYREGTPRTVLEAMAMGRAIITTDAPGCRETVIDGENGFLVPVKSVGALVEAMQRFIDNSGLAAKMGRRSREIAEEKYDVRKVNEVMLHEMGIT